MICHQVGRNHLYELQCGSRAPSQRRFHLFWCTCQGNIRPLGECSNQLYRGFRDVLRLVKRWTYFDQLDNSFRELDNIPHPIDSCFICQQQEHDARTYVLVRKGTSVALFVTLLHLPFWPNWYSARFYRQPENRSWFLRCLDPSWKVVDCKRENLSCFFSTLNINNYNPEYLWSSDTNNRLLLSMSWSLYPSFPSSFSRPVRSSQVTTELHIHFIRSSWPTTSICSRNTRTKVSPV